MTEPICQPNLEEALITEQIRMPTTNDFVSVEHGI